jgi:hypothetical protein
LAQSKSAEVEFTSARNHGAELGRVRRYVRQAVLAQLTEDTSTSVSKARGEVPDIIISTA